MKKAFLLLFAVVAAAWLLAGCAGVTITEADGKTETALTVRLPETYLLVTFPADLDKPATAQIVVLPTGRELRLKPHSGIGSANLQFVLTNGALSSWGVTTDSKVPETITAVTGLLAQVKAEAIKENRADKERVLLFRIVPADSSGGVPHFQRVPFPGE